MPVDMKVKTKVNLSGLIRMNKSVRDQLSRPSAQGPLRDAFTQWAARYRSFSQQKFDANSKGSGDWPPLAESTKKRRRGPRKGFKGNRSFTVLRDTGTLYRAFTPQFVRAPGQLELGIRNGIRVGFGGKHKHPSGGVTVADVASFHNSGAGRLPKRQLIHDPDARTAELMAGDLNRALDRIVRGSKV